MSAHEPIRPLGHLTDWATSFARLAERTRSDPPDSQLPLSWALHAWANETLDSAAIRIDGSEGLIGPAPARWRLLCHAEEPGYAIAVLDGRAPLQPANVLASLLVAPERPPIITTRAERAPLGPASPVAAPDRIRTGVGTPSAALAAIVDLVLGRLARVSGSAAAIPAAVRLAASLALRERGASLVWSAPPRRGTRRPRGFVASWDPANARRQLSAVEAALRKRGRR